MTGRDRTKDKVKEVLDDLKRNCWKVYSDLSGKDTEPYAERIMELVDQLVSELREEYSEIYQFQVKPGEFKDRDS